MLGKGKEDVKRQQEAGETRESELTGFRPRERLGTEESSPSSKKTGQSRRKG